MLSFKTPLFESYLDWLVIKLRYIRELPSFKIGLNLEYIESNFLSSFEDRKNLINFLQFLVYAAELDYKTNSLGNISYRQIVFRVQDFLKYQNPNVKSIDYHQFKKLTEFFKELQKNSMMQIFTSIEYRSLITIPQVILRRSKKNCLMAHIWIAEELFYYRYPFFLPDVFKTKLTKHEFEVAFKVLQVFSSKDAEKKFLIQEFFDSYPSALSNQTKTRMKNYFIQIIKKYEKYGLIEKKYKVILDNSISSQSISKADELTTDNVSEGFIMYERISIHNQNIEI